MSLELFNMLRDSRPKPALSYKNLRERVERLLRHPAKRVSNSAQLTLALPSAIDDVYTSRPTGSIVEFLDFMTDAQPKGDIYLFGGVLRDIAFFGKRGFSSDIDLVVEGNWNNCVPYLEALGAKRNKFGGYRLAIAGWPIDIWSAEKTWAFEQNLIPYNGVGSLTKTTILNWDAILMNWRTKTFICSDSYLEQIDARLMDVVLVANPNPLGMAVRVLRHFCSKDARHITTRAATYMADCVKRYSLEALRAAERKTYGDVAITARIYNFLQKLNSIDGSDIRESFEIASRIVEMDLARRRVGRHETE